MSSPFVARVANYARHPLTLAGVGLTTIAGLSLVVFLILETAGQVNNPYTGLFGSAFLPALFVFGLLLIPIGILFRRRKLRRSGANTADISTYPKLDFNDPHVRRVGFVIAGLTAINIVVLVSSTVVAMNYMDSTAFCGTVCHKVMQPEYAAYQNSPHSRVKCVQCHIGPGASWAVRSKLDGLRQVWGIATGSYARPIPSPVHTLRPARDTCESCHWPAKHYGDKLRIIGRFATDEKNTPSYTAMLLRTGGGAAGTGKRGGIHWWHIYADNRIRYLATDPRRQEIAWVEIVRPDGKRTEYVRDPKKTPSAATIETEGRLMDCIDCHNRPTHLFETPPRALDEVLSHQPELMALPFFKREAQKAIVASYATHAQGVAGVRKAVLDFYRSYPAVPPLDQALVAVGAEQAAGIYGRTVFPEMRTDGTTHPSNIGHETSPGCFRCHDGSMQEVNGAKTISGDCETCHTMLVQDSPTYPDLAKLGAPPVPTEPPAPPARGDSP